MPAMWETPRIGVNGQRQEFDHIKKGIGNVGCSFGISPPTDFRVTSPTSKFFCL
jgi:hypothetical protein